MIKKLAALLSMITIVFFLIVVWIYYVISSGEGLSLYSCGKDNIEKISRGEQQSYAIYRMNCGATTGFSIHVAHLESSQIGESICTFKGEQYVVNSEEVTGHYMTRIELLVDGEEKSCIFPETLNGT